VWYPDLGTTCQIASGHRVRAVGWLSAEHEFTRGQVAQPALDALRVLVSEGYCPVALAGLLYAAPAMVVHYIEAHGYQPPLAFIDAVIACPVPPDPAYYDALRPFGSVWNYSDDDWNQLLDTEPAAIAELRRAARDERGTASKRKRFDW
jgi:hypothetical protein